MLIPRIVRGGPDKIFAIVKNSEASATMSDGEVVVFSVSVTANWGSDVLKATAASQLTVAGVMSGRDVLAGDFGLCQIYGFHPNVKTTAAALAAGLTVNSDTAAAALAAIVAGAGLGVSLKLGAANRAGIMLKVMGL